MYNLEERSTDNCWHPLRHPSYVEWWYLDAIFQTGDVLSGSLGLWGDLSRPAEVTVRSDFFMRRPTGDLLDFGCVTPFAQFQASTTRCDVHLGSHRLMERNGRFTLYLADPSEDAALQLEYTPLFPGFGYRYTLGDSERAFWWTVPAPCASVRGTLQQAGHSIPLQGTGYHDHNWASISIMRHFGGWDWWRWHHQSGTLVFARVLAPQGGVLFQLLHQADAATSRTHTVTGDTDDAAAPWRIRSAADDFLLELTPSDTDCLLCRSSDSYSVGQQYGRFLSHGTGTLGQGSVRHRLHGPLLHESQRFNGGD